MSNFVRQVALLTTKTGVPPEGTELTEAQHEKLAIRSTIYRTVFIFTIFLGLIMALFNVSGYFVYKIEEYQGDEVQVWSHTHTKVFIFIPYFRE